MTHASYDPSNIFARILKGELPCYRLYEDDVVLAILDIMPRADGHTLVIPKVESRHFLDFPPEALGEVMQRVQCLAKGVMNAMEAEGVLIQQFNEAASGQEIFHLHFHILPCWSNVALRPSGVKAAPELLERFAGKIKNVVN